jgi:hypothetical protein
LARAAVRLLCTQESTPKEDDSWAQAPVPETELSVSAGAKRRTTAGGGALFTRRFAFSTHRNRCARCMICGPRPHARGWTAGCGEDEGAHYREAVAHSLRGGSPS